MNITVVYADPDQNIEITLDASPSSTAEEVIAKSRVLEKLSLDPGLLSVGVYGKKIALTDKLVENDRLEIYRPLTIDPKTARRLRAEKRAKEV